MSKQSVNFSPYQPPPDGPSESSNLSSGSSKSKSKRPWFTRDASGYGGSYQSGGSGAEPSSAPQYLTNDPESLADPSYMQSNGSTLPSDSVTANAWESRFGWRIDLLAALAYLGGPVTGEFAVSWPVECGYAPKRNLTWWRCLAWIKTALLLLILETTNDYVRFHAYQSALLTTPILILWFFMLVLHFWRWLRIIYALLCVSLILYTAFRAFRDPSSSRGMGGLPGGGIPRFYLPVIGDLADKWVGEE